MTTPHPAQPHDGHRPGSQPHDGPRQHGGHGQPAAPMPAELSAVLAEIVPPGGRFGHRQHIHLAFAAVHRYGPEHAPEVVSRWIRHIAAYERAPQKFNATLTCAWTKLVAHHITRSGPATSFSEFAERNGALLDKRLLARHYSSRVLASPAARAGWVPPDLLPFPWPGTPEQAG